MAKEARRGGGRRGDRETLLKEGKVGGEDGRAG